MSASAQISPILQPVVALVVWSHVMWVWMYAERLPALTAAKVKFHPAITKADIAAAVPAKAQWPADNYNHLMEQPTVFYATALVLALAGQGTGWALTLAWAYVALRVVHSLVQATINKIELRFGVFALSSFTLMGMAVLAVAAVF
jgi:hypothetical protein